MLVFQTRACPSVPTLNSFSHAANRPRETGRSGLLQTGRARRAAPAFCEHAEEACGARDACRGHFEFLIPAQLPDLDLCFFLDLASVAFLIHN